MLTGNKRSLSKADSRTVVDNTLIRSRRVPGSILGPESNYPDWIFVDPLSLSTETTSFQVY
jgi:hypothetical protein